MADARYKEAGHKEAWWMTGSITEDVYAGYVVDKDRKTDRINQPRVEAAIRELLAAIGEDPDREGLRDTPNRVARMYGELVVMEAEHMCMTIRGIEKPGSRTITSAVRGTLKNDAVTREEALRLIRG